MLLLLLLLLLEVDDRAECCKWWMAGRIEKPHADSNVRKRTSRVPLFMVVVMVGFGISSLRIVVFVVIIIANKERNSIDE